MARRSRTAVLAVVATLAAGMTLAAAQRAGTPAGETFTARLSWVPISGAERADVTGRGSATATLTGQQLAITGTFEGLAAPATVARLHQGLAKGVRGLSIADLTITRAVAGKLSGTVTLNAEQVEDLRQGRLYVQVHSEKGVAPDGSNLWGWLLR